MTRLAFGFPEERYGEHVAGIASARAVAAQRGFAGVWVPWRAVNVHEALFPANPRKLCKVVAMLPGDLAWTLIPTASCGSWSHILHMSYILFIIIWSNKS